ncbi:MAG: sigma-54 dependent transcriptional regulator, partial [Gallionella sp.]
TAQDKSVPVVMVTAHGKTGDAVRAIRAGAYDYVAKPFLNQDIVLTVRRAIEEKSLKGQKRKSFTESGSGNSLLEIMGKSPAIQRIQSEVERVAKTNLSVLLQGESGTGKEVVARAIHAASQRADKPFVALDCGAIPATLIENELFGHEKGAFTGAHQAQVGAFEMASGGTLFLDEIGNLPLAMQSTLLRVLETQRIRKIGGTREQQIDFRLVAATNMNLQATVRQQTFRDDLYYRLAEYTINLPSLHERSEDIVFLAHRFLAQANMELGKQVAGMTVQTEELLRSYSWPGNVRELRNQIRRAILLCIDPAGVITPELFVALNVTAKPEKLLNIDQRGLNCSCPDGKSAFTITSTRLQFSGAGESLKDITASVTAQVERLVLLQALQHARGNKAQAARLLKIDYKTMHSKLKMYEISSNQFMRDPYKPTDSGSW